jgi:low-affinity inorganic phosphate transporter
MVHMLELFSGLEPWVLVSLVLALLFVLSFEFINGFHDTANAVATVIYTKALPAHLAVMLSGLFNFLGVLLGGVGVAYAIVHLLPVELLINVDTGSGLIMVFALLAAAIIWNLGTWYLGLPASSSHTLIGSILGVGLGNALLRDMPLGAGVNWNKAIDICLSLIISPVAGFIVAGLVLVLLRRSWPVSKMHQTPEGRKELKGKKRPPFWNRFVLIVSAMAVSFVHGSNDGQKGIGLIMLVLIGIVPANFVLDRTSTSYEITRTANAAVLLEEIYLRHQQPLHRALDAGKKLADSHLPAHYSCDARRTPATTARLRQVLGRVSDYHEMPPAERVEVRRHLLCLDDAAKRIARLPGVTSAEQSDLAKLRKDLTLTTEYAPFWVILAVALALGLGTMVGWKRVVLTVGEKIGKAGMTYAQGMSAQLTAVAAIGVANIYSLPVSTTHILSSGVAGTMVANRTGLQAGTVKAILMAWVLTLPASILLAAGLFWLGTAVVG